ncbi:MAG TPA: DUF4011 domain-containing protein [Jiangellaceae bacterium]
MTTVHETAAARPPATEPASRAELVADAVVRWTDELRALGGKDPLLYFRDLKIGTLDLAAADPETRKKLIDGEPVLVSRLFPHEPLRKSALRSARAIRDKARELAEERGIDTAMLAIGVATWANPFAAHRPTAPVLLRPAAVVARDPAETDFVIEVSTEASVNPVLLHALDTQLGLRFGLDSLRDRAGRLRYPHVVERLREFAPAHVIDGFSISHRAMLGTFAVEPDAAVADLDALAPELDAHDVVAALAGDEQAAQAVRTTAAHAPDRPLRLVLDADPAQTDVVAAVAAGRSLRVDAPPGTGRTQTIVNLVAELVASGQRVLIVGSKRAGLTALLDRLTSAGLDDVVLDLSSVKATREAVNTVIETAQRLAPSQGDETEGPAQPVSEAAGPERKPADDGALRRYLDALHVGRDPWGCSAYELMAAIAAADPEARTPARVPGDALVRYGVGTREALRVKLRAYAELGGLAAAVEITPWSGAAVPTTGAAERIRSAVDELRATTLPELRNAATRACVEVGLTGPASPADAFAAVDLLTSVAGTLDEFQPDIWSAPLDEFVAATADRRERTSRSGRMGLVARRRVRLQIRDIQVNPSALRARADVHARLVSVQEQLSEWRRRARDSRLPRTGPHLPAAVRAVAAARAGLTVLADVHADLADIHELPFADLAARLAKLAGASDVLMALPKLAELRSDLEAAGLGDLLGELTRRDAGPDVAEAAFAYCWHSSVLDHVLAADPALGRFDRVEHERRLAARRRSPEESSVGTVLAGRAARFAQVADEHEGQAAVILESAHTHSGPRSLPELVSAAPEITLATKPCWVMPPLAVPALLPKRRLFDVVIIEDSGQISPAEAVPAIARAERVVVIGDREQLTLLGFTTAIEPITESDDQQSTYDMFTDSTEHPASVYEALAPALTRLPLLTEYRIREDRLAAFASRRSYGDRLTVIPSAASPRLCHELVAADDDAGVDSSEAEVRRVVETVFEHARTRPHESLGVITLSRPHAARIDAALRAALIRAPDVAPFLRDDREEPFFIKDVDRVCGDVRDAIILTLGYGRSVDGRVLYRFGALDRPGGDRRLAAAITRARDRMTVVSSFGADDLSPRRLTTEGGRALKDFLAHAEAPGAMSGSGRGDALAIAVAERLRAAGASVVLGYGGGTGAIEVAVRHPLRRDRFVLAIETDGPAYAALPIAQQQSRIRRDMLVRLGWSVHRVWSAAWAADPDGENARLVDAYAKAVADADAFDWAVAAAEADVVAGSQEERPEAAGAEDGTSGRRPGRSSKRGGKGARGKADPMGEAAPDRPDGKVRPDGLDGEAGSDKSDQSSGDDGGADSADSGQADRGGKPVLVRRRPVGDHSRRELAALARWVESGRDGRPEADVAAELADELDVLRRGPRTDDVLVHAVRVARAGAPELS